MDRRSDALKIWVGGLSQATTKQSLDAYFSQFGQADSIVMMDSATGRSRGFGFVNFADETVFQAVLGMQHVIDGANVRVDAKSNQLAKPAPTAAASSLAAALQGLEMAGTVAGAPVTLAGGGGGLGRDRLKIWVGGLSQVTTKQSLDAYFQQFGEADSIVMMDSATGRSRGFGFVNFADENVMQQVLLMQHEIDGSAVRVDAHGASPKQQAGVAAASIAPVAPAVNTAALGGLAGGALANLQSVLGGLGLTITGAAAPQPVVAAPVPIGDREARDRLKIWVGGLSQETTKQSLDAYFNQFGTADSIVMMDSATGRSRGFGFVNFFDETVMNAVLGMQHEIDGTLVRVDHRSNTPSAQRGATGSVAASTLGLAGGLGQLGLAGSVGAVASPSLGLGADRATMELRDRMKIWVGGLAQETTKQSLDAYFSQFGQADSIVMMDSATGRSRGFGFVNFFDQAVMDRVLTMQHQIDGSNVRIDVKVNNKAPPAAAAVAAPLVQAAPVPAAAPAAGDPAQLVASIATTLSALSGVLQGGGAQNTQVTEALGSIATLLGAAAQPKPLRASPY